MVKGRWEGERRGYLRHLAQVHRKKAKLTYFTRLVHRSFIRHLLISSVVTFLLLFKPIYVLQSKQIGRLIMNLKLWANDKNVNFSYLMIANWELSRVSFSCKKECTKHQSKRKYKVIKCKKLKVKLQNIHPLKASICMHLKFVC